MDSNITVLIGTISGTIIGSAMTFCIQNHLQKKNNEYMNKCYIRDLKLEKYDLLLDEIKSNIRSLSSVYIGIENIVIMLENGTLTNEKLEEVLNNIQKEGDFYNTSIYRYDFLFKNSNIRDVLNSELYEDTLNLHIKIIPRITMENIQKESFSWDMKLLARRSKELSDMFTDVSDSIKKEMQNNLF